MLLIAGRERPSYLSGDCQPPVVDCTNLATPRNSHATLARFICAPLHYSVPEGCSKAVGCGCELQEFSLTITYDALYRVHCPATVEL